MRRRVEYATLNCCTEKYLFIWNVLNLKRSLTVKKKLVINRQIWHEKDFDWTEFALML